MIINVDKLRYWFNSIEQILNHKKKYVTTVGRQRHVFVDRGSSVLLVAHLDTILPPKINKIKKGRIHAQGLDDRLGCYIAWELGQYLNLDVLLTEDEEKCCSSAGNVVLKDYNWIAEFDRMGTDVVTYDRDNKKFLEDVEEYWLVGMGSYSDIVDLDTTACCMNLGIGYQHPHSKDSYAELSKTQDQIDRFLAFFNKHKDTQYIADVYPDEYAYDYHYGFGRKTSSLNWCDLCGVRMGDEIHGYYLCKDCFDSLVNTWACS